MSDEFYDLCYGAWMTGRDPDAANRDDYDRCLAAGYYEDEIPLDWVYPDAPAESQH